MSGHPVLAKSLAMMRRLSQLVPEGCLLIGAGGVMTPGDALQMQQAGAQLVQLYSAFIYQGPTIVRRMARQLNRSNLKGNVIPQDYANPSCGRSEKVPTAA